jgi:HK97 family phage major capsid protein
MKRCAEAQALFSYGGFFMSKQKIEELKAKLQEHLVAARDVCALAEKEKREFTTAEKKTVDQHLKEARELREQLKKAEGDEAAKQAILDLGAGVNLSWPVYGNNGAKAGSWSKAFQTEINRRYSPNGVKALIEPTGAVGVPGVIAGLTPIGERVETILQLIPWTGLDGTDAFSYLRETKRTHNAATVAVGEKKPVSTYTVQRVDDRARTIAHLSEPIPRQYLSDVPLLQQYVEGVLREGYQLELEYQILQGDGEGENFTGLLETVGRQVQLFDTDLLTTCRKAITLLELASIPPGAFVFHPADWERFELLTETTGGFLLKDATNIVPIDRARRRLWGVPVALSLGIPEGTGLLVDFRGSTRGWERERVRVDWSEAFYTAGDDYDDNPSTGFQRNLIQFRCEGRAGFAVLRPRGVVEIALDPAEYDG